MEKNVYPKDKCCGCGLCAINCPKKAIKMKEDQFGFVYPYIDEQKCINCGLCEKTCSFNKLSTNKYEQKAYVAVSKEEEILKSTASGGIFTSIAIDFIQKKGIVYGCTLQNEKDRFKIKHIRIDKIRDLEQIKGSKYVQSNIVSIFNKIKEDLSMGLKVLFSGTPCQVSAVKSFTKNPDNLFTIDIICHGVPNEKMFNDYIDIISKKEKCKIESFNFRDKTKGWGLNYSYVKNNKKTIKSSFKSSYYQMFLDSKTYRKNCYSCPYANDNRIGDITIGDYWGIEKEHPDLIINKKIDNKKGVSCIIINSKKGKSLFDDSSNNIRIYKTEIKKIKKHNHQLNNPSKIPSDREIIMNIYLRSGYKEVDRYYNSKNSIKNIIRTIWYLIPYKLRKIIKK